MEVEDEEAALSVAQKELLEARASYHVRQNVVNDVLQADPLLKAVHAGTNGTPSERYGVTKASCVPLNIFQGSTSVGGPTRCFGNVPHQSIYRTL